MSGISAASLAGAFSVKAFGALGDGAANDGAAIVAAYAAALKAAANGTAGYAAVIWPPGTYLIDCPIPQYPTVRTVDLGAVVSPYQGYAGDCFQVTSSNAVRYATVGLNLLPSVVGAFASGIHYMPNSVLHKAVIGSIENCAVAVLADYNEFAIGPVFDHTLDFNYIYECTYGIKLQGTQRNSPPGITACQGLIMRGNFILQTQYPIFFTDTSAAANDQVVNNHFDIRNVDGGNVPGAQAITFEHAHYVGGLNTFLIPNFLGNFPAGYIRSQNGGSAYGHDYTITQLGAAYGDFDGLTTPGALGANVCRTVGTAVYQGLAATTTPGSRSTFAGGGAIVANRYELTLTFASALASGASADFYCYSPLTTGVAAQPKCLVQDGSLPVVVTCCRDESVANGAAPPVANQVHLRVTAFAPVAANASMIVTVECGT